LISQGFPFGLRRPHFLSGRLEALFASLSTLSSAGAMSLCAVWLCHAHPVSAAGPLEYTRSTLEQARAIVASDQTHRIRLAFSGGAARFSVQTPDLGEAQDELAVTYEGEPLEIGFNATYLLEILKFMPTDEVRLTFKAPERAATIEPVGWDDTASYMALVMPLRLVD
jgi:hypothetical protein